MAEVKAVAKLDTNQMLDAVGEKSEHNRSE